MTRSRQRQPGVATTPPATPAKATWLPFAAIAIVVAAAAVRIAGAKNDLWLDELWSLDVATHVTRALDVFSLHHEINHYANTLWLRLVGPGGEPVEYRGISLLAGCVSVCMAGVIGRRRDIPTAMIAMLLVGASYELIVFSSEARGYSLLVCCALAAYVALDTDVTAPSRARVAAFNLVAIVGLLAHPMFVSVLGAAGTWVLLRLLRAPLPSRMRLLVLAKYFAIPALVLGVLYVVDLRLVEPGGGTAAPSLSGAYLTATAWAVAPPMGPLWRAASLVALAAAAVFAVLLLRKEQPDVWVFFAGAIVVFPLALMLFRKSNLIYTRHFIVGTVFLLVLCSVVLGAWWARGGTWRAAVIAILIAYALSNGVYTRELLNRGRGQYSAAVAYLAQNTPGGLKAVGADHDLRVGFVLEYYLAAAMMPDAYVPSPWGANGVQWIIAHAETSGPPIPPGMASKDPAGNAYELDQIFPSAPLTGLHWFAYRRVNAGVSTPPDTVRRP